MDSTQALLFIDTDDKIKNNPILNNAEVAFPVNFKANSVKRVALASYDFITAFDNINEANQIAIIEDNMATSYPVFVATGRYTRAGLATVIETSLNLLGLGLFTVTYVTDHFELNSPVPIFFPSNPYKPNGKDWGDMLGIPKNSGFGTLFIGGLPDIAYTNKLYIICDDIHRFKLMSDESTTEKLQNVLGVVYLNNDVFIDDNLIIPKHSTTRLPWLKWVKHKLLTELGPLNFSIRDDRGDRIPDSQVGKLKWSLELFVEEGFVL